MLADKKKITIAIVDDHPIVLEGLQKVLMQAYDYVSAICFNSGGEFLNFTKREKEIIKLVAEGNTSAVIAEQLHVSPLTVETRRRNLMQKFNVKSMAAAIKVAMDNGLL